MEINDFLEERWSPRSFSGNKVSMEQVQKLFEAGSRAPSAFNEQPWRFIVGFNNDSTHQLICDVLVEANRLWAQNASILAIGISSDEYQRNGKQNAHSKYDLGAATAFLSMKAREEGFYVHQMAGFDADLARQNFKIPDEFTAMVAIAIGEKASPDELPEKLKDAELKRSKRNPLESFLFTEQFGQSLK